MIYRNRRKVSRWDPIRVLLGAHILLNQFTEECNTLVLYYIAQYVRSSTAAENVPKKEEAQYQKECSSSMILMFIQFAQILSIDTQVSI